MRALILSLALGIPACPRPPVPPAPLGDAGSPCLQAEERLRELQCESAGTPLWKTAAGTPLSEVCQRWTQDGRDIMSNGQSRARCIAASVTCQAAEKCR